MTACVCVCARCTKTLGRGWFQHQSSADMKQRNHCVIHAACTALLKVSNWLEIWTAAAAVTRLAHSYGRSGLKMTPACCQTLKVQQKFGDAAPLQHSLVSDEGHF